jgi:hypothetical protein
MREALRRSGCAGSRRWRSEISRRERRGRRDGVPARACFARFSSKKNRVLPRSWLDAWRKRLCVLRVLCAKYSGSRPRPPAGRGRKAGGARTDILRSHGQASGYTDIGARHTDRGSRHTDIGARRTDTSSPRTDTRRGARGVRVARLVVRVRERAVRALAGEAPRYRGRAAATAGGPGGRVAHAEKRRRARACPFKRRGWRDNTRRGR